jgi:allantoin racemase
MPKALKNILYVQPSVCNRLNQSTGDEFINIIQEYLENQMSPGYGVKVRSIKYGGELPTSEYYICIATPYIVEEILKGEREGYDGAIVGCFGNLAVRQAREVVKIPVVGPGEAACYVACLLGDKISIITTGARIQHKNLKLNEKYHHQFYTSIQRELQAQGLLDRVVSIRTTNISSEGGIGAFTEEGLISECKVLLEQGKKAIEEDGADVLVLGCALMMGVANKIQEDLGVPVVDPTLTALKVTEMLISMNLTHSPLSYPFTNVQADKCAILYPPSLKGYHGYANLKDQTKPPSRQV